MPLNPKEQQSLLAFREQRRQAVEDADASVREQEGNFVKGAAKGAVASIPIAIASLIELITPEQWTGGLTQDTANMLEDTLVNDENPGEATGYSAGNVIGDAAQVVLDPVVGAVKAAGVVGKVLTKEDEIAKLALSQLRDMKAGHVSGIDPRPPYWAKKGAEDVAGVGYKDVDPAAISERNPSGFPAKDTGTLYDAEGNVMGFKNDKTYTNWSQHAGDPSKARGGPPSGYGEAGQLLADTSIYANKREKTWRNGKFDPVAFKALQEKALKTKARTLAKGKLEGSPEFWVFEESTGKVIVAKQTENGLFVGVPKGRQAKAIVGKDGNGNPIFNEKIDAIVDSDAVGKINASLAKARYSPATDIIEEVRKAKANTYEPPQPLIDDFNNRVPPKRETLTLKKK